MRKTITVKINGYSMRARRGEGLQELFSRAARREYGSTASVWSVNQDAYDSDGRHFFHATIIGAKSVPSNGYPVLGEIYDWITPAEHRWIIGD